MTSEDLTYAEDLASELTNELADAHRHAARIAELTSIAVTAGELDAASLASISYLMGQTAAHIERSRETAASLIHALIKDMD